jgi:hypothetical protein
MSFTARLEGLILCSSLGRTVMTMYCMECDVIVWSVMLLYELKGGLDLRGYMVI